MCENNPRSSENGIDISRTNPIYGIPIFVFSGVVYIRKLVEGWRGPLYDYHKIGVVKDGQIVLDTGEIVTFEPK